MQRTGAHVPFGEKWTQKTRGNPLLMCTASLLAGLPMSNDSGAPSASLLMILAHVHSRLSVPRTMKANRQPALSWQP